MNVKATNQSWPCDEPAPSLWSILTCISSLTSISLSCDTVLLYPSAQRGEIADSSIEVDTTSHVSHEYGNKELTLRNGGGTGSSSSSLTAARVHEHGSIVTVGSGKSGGNDRGGGGGRVSSSGALAMPSSWNEEQYQQEQQHHQQQQYSYPSHTPPPHASSAHNNNAQHHPPQHEEYSGDVPEMQRSFVVKPGVRVHDRHASPTSPP